MKWFGLILFFAGCAVGSSIGTDPVDKATIASNTKRIQVLEQWKSGVTISNTAGQEFKRLTVLANTYEDSFFVYSSRLDTQYAYTYDTLGNIQRDELGNAVLDYAHFDIVNVTMVDRSPKYDILWEKQDSIISRRDSLMNQIYLNGIH